MRDLAVRNAIKAMQRAVAELDGYNLYHNAYDSAQQDLLTAIDGLLAIDNSPYNTLTDTARKAGISPAPKDPYIDYNHSWIPLHL